MDGILALLDSIGGAITMAAIVGFVVLNLGFIALVALRKDRHVVNRWTKPLVVADAILLLAAGGAPVAGWALKSGVRVVAAVMPDLGAPAPKAAPADAVEIADPATPAPLVPGATALP
jgi:hypothetical protein